MKVGAPLYLKFKRETSAQEQGGWGIKTLPPPPLFFAQVHLHSYSSRQRGVGFFATVDFNSHAFLTLLLF